MVRQREYDRLSKTFEIGEEAHTSDSTPVWKKIVALGESAPESAWDNVPTDLARNWRSYKYGRQKVRSG